MDEDLNKCYKLLSCLGLEELLRLRDKLNVEIKWAREEKDLLGVHN